jgi:uncharacterized protein involved in outer membrane biogenesis
LELKAFGVEEADGSPLLKLDILLINFDPFSSLYHRAWTFSQIDLTAPSVHVVAGPNGRLNLSELFAGNGVKNVKKPQPAEDHDLPRVLIEKVALRGGKIRFIDQKTTPPADIRLTSLTVDLDDLTTIPDRTGGYVVSGRTKEGESLRWKGTGSISPIWSKGSFKLEGVKGATLWDFLRERIACEKPPGQITVAGKYLFDLRGEAPIFTLEGLHVDVSDLSVTLRGEPTPMVSLKKVAATGGTFSWDERSFAFEALRLQGGLARTELGKEGRTNWMELLGNGGRNTERSSPAKSPESKGETEEAGKGTIGTVRPLGPWSGSLQSFEMKDFRIHFTDHTTEPHAEMTLDPFNLSLIGLSTNPKAEVDFDLSTRVEQKGDITAKGKARPWARVAQGHVEVKNFSLPLFQPYLNPLARLTLESGSVNTSGDFSYGKRVGEENVSGLFTYKGGGEIRGVRMRTSEKGPPVWGWKTLACSKIYLSISPDAVQLGEVRLVAPSARLIIYEDGTVNLSRILVETKKQNKKKQNPNSASKVTVERIMLEQGSLEFADLSKSPRFHALIHELKGAIARIWSVPGTTANIALDGQVDEYGLARIQGKTFLFSPAETTDLSLHFRNLDMSHLTPYAVHFAGYRIASGKLSLDLRYSIENGKLVGRNQVVTERLKLGERVKSPTALDLPFELAIALLTNSDGVIEVGFPVSGDLNDPKFSFSGVVRQALADLVKKIVTAPFSWLAGLLGSEKENLDTVFFDPGKAILLPPEAEKLKDVSKALAKRPQLMIQIRGGYEADIDRLALQGILMRAKLASATQQVVPSDEEPGPAVFDDPDTQKAIEKIFLESNPAGMLTKLRGDYRKSLGPEKKGGDKIEKAAVWGTFYKELYGRLEKQIEISEKRLITLAEARADAINESLVNEGRVEARRIEVLKPVKTSTPKNKGVASKLSLGAVKS